MSDSNRSELFAVLERLSEMHPNVRLGQFIANLTRMVPGPDEINVYDVEDEQLLESALSMITYAENRDSVEVECIAAK